MGLTRGRVRVYAGGAVPLFDNLLSRVGRVFGLVDEVTTAAPAPTAVSDTGSTPIDAPAAAPNARHGILRMVTDSFGELFTGKFFEGQEHVKDVLEGGWQPRTGYGDLVIEMLGRTGLARRILALRALDATREGWTVRFPTLDPDEAAKAAARMDTLHQNLGTQAALYRALFKSEQWGEAIIVMGIDDGLKRADATQETGASAGSSATGRDEDSLFAQPLDMAKINKLLWLKVFHKNEYNPGPLSGHDTNNFGLPEYYDIPDFTRPDLISLERAERTPQSARVHYTRVLRFNTEDGHSRLDEVAQALEDYFANARSGRRAANVFSIAVYSIAGWIEKITSNETAAINRIAIQHKGLQKLGAVIVDKNNEEFRYQGSGSAAGLADLIDRSATSLLAWTGYPAMILLGQDPAGFSSGEEVIRHYYDTVRVVQKLQIERPLRRINEVLMVSEEGPEGIEVAPEQWGIKFAPLRVLTAKELAEVRNLVYTGAIELKKADLLDRTEVREGLFRDNALDMLPEFRLRNDAPIEKREQLPVGIVQAITNTLVELYGGNPPPEALRAFFGAVVPEIADIMPLVFKDKPAATETPNAPDPGVDPAADDASGDQPYEKWLFAEEVADEFSASKRTLEKHRTAEPGVDKAEPGKLTWIVVGNRPRYRRSEVRALFESGVLRTSGPPRPDAPVVEGSGESTGTGSSGHFLASTTTATTSNTNSTDPKAR